MSQVDGLAKMKGPITKCQAPRGGGTVIEALVSIDITLVTAFVTAIVVAMLVEFCGYCGCTHCLRTYSRRE